MIKYRFTKKEVDEMSFNIRTHTDTRKARQKARGGCACYWKGWRIAVNTIKRKRRKGCAAWLCTKDSQKTIY